MAGRAVQEMIDEEPKIDMTPMIDVVFLLLIFFMLMKFKSYEKKLDSHLPKDDGMMDTDPEVQHNLTIRLIPYGDPTRIMITGGSENEGFPAIPWQAAMRVESGREVEYAAPAMFRMLQANVLTELEKEIIDKKIVLAPHPEIPFDYVALTLDAVHKAHEQYVESRAPGTFQQLRQLGAEAENSRHAGQSGQSFEDRRKEIIENLRDQKIWKDITFEAPPLQPE